VPAVAETGAGECPWSTRQSTCRAQTGNQPWPFEVVPASADDEVEELPPALAGTLVIPTLQDRRGAQS